MKTLLLFLVTLALALPVAAVNGTDWVTEPGGSEKCELGNGGRVRCFWYFDGAGNSPVLGFQSQAGCRSISLKISGSSHDVDPYICLDVTCTTTTRLEGWVRSTGAYGDLTLDATTWGIYGITDRSLQMQRQAGSGNVLAECE